MNYINTETKKLVNANGDFRAEPFIVDYLTVQSISFTFLDFTIPQGASLYFAGGTKNYSTIIFLSGTYTIQGNNTIVFSLDTYTQQYLDNIKRKNTQINIEIGLNVGEQKIILLRDTALANPRVYKEGVTPTELQIDYYTKQQVNSILSEGYWDKQQVAQAIANVQTMDIIVVQELPPVAQAHQYTIYLVPATDAEQDNVYNEYLVINGEYQLIGSTAVDLSQYVQKSGFTLLNGKDFIIKNTNNQNVLDVHGYGGAWGSGNFTTGQGGAISIGTSNSAGQYTVCLGKENHCTVLNGNNQLVGYGLKTTTANHSIYGRWNEDTLTGVNTCIGNGTSDSDRSNAVLFKTDKTIEINQSITTHKPIIIAAKTSDGISERFEMSYAGTIEFYIQQGKMGLGFQTSTGGNYGSLCVGYQSNATGGYGCTTLGRGLTNNKESTLVIGKYNVALNNEVFVIGNGVNSSNRNNCFTVDNTGNVTADGVIVSAGQKINTLTSNSFTPIDNQVFKYTLSADTAFTIDTTDLTANNQINFELHLTQGATAYTPSFTNTIIWGDGDVFDSSNTMPTMTDTNTVYVLIFRWDGEDLLCNLAYTKKVVAQ